jgi:hypothetical protein
MRRMGIIAPRPSTPGEWESQEKDRRGFSAPGASHLITTDLRAKDPARLAEVLALMTRLLSPDTPSL